MLKSHVKFHSSNGKRLILVADDEQINRELLGAVLAEDYEVIFAVNGEETLEQCRAHKDTLSLVLLDLMMPVMPGLEALRRMKADPELRDIPVIVMTADQNAEIESLSLGAIDFIPKPYPQPGVILARALRIIELNEDREIIQHTERDPLTGLYNREFFYSYAAQFDQHHPDAQMDAIVVDVNHFHMINERFGTAYGDEVLRRIGERVRDMVRDSDGIVCRREADTFLVYCPHGKDYDAILENASIGLTEDDTSGNRVRLRMGVYPNVDKSLDVERRFDRAKMAADMVQGSFTRTIGIYDNALHDKQIFAEQLIEDFRAAIDEEQFCVYFQPKFDIRKDIPVLYSCEALVRWKHPRLGMISPGMFIPLFEENGLIQELDNYVWRETCRQLREWRERLGFTVPVSVNVSRIDMYDPNLIPTLQSNLRENGLSYDDLLLEVTESAYTQDSEQIVRTVKQLRKLGFQIEMDDFGTGYSSLNMLSTLPIDVLKLDMQFVRSMFATGGDIRMLEVIIDIAGYLSVPVVAEGVETADQVSALKAMGCDIVQGYYFSKPVPAGEFDAFLIAARDMTVVEEAPMPEEPAQQPVKPESLPQIPDRIQPVEEPHSSTETLVDSAHHGIHLRTASFIAVILAFLSAFALFVTDISISHAYQRMEQASSRYIAAQQAVSDMETGSDYLTDRVRCFVVTGGIDYLRDFFEEVDVTRRRDHALENLDFLLEGNDNSAYALLSTALDLSNELMQREHLAIRLIVDAGDYPADEIPAVINEIQLDAQDAALSPDAKREKAQSLLFDSTYVDYKARIRENVSLCAQELFRTSLGELELASERLSSYVRLQTALTVILLLIVLLIVVFISTQVRKPLSRMVELMRNQQPVPPTGAEELQFVTRTYNSFLLENKTARERLSHEASHDRLTGLFNRGAYEMMMQSVDTVHMALILVDIDYFKSINDNFGHDVGDKVLKRVADILRHSFRSVDIICRIGGDEFVVIMTRADSSMRDLVIRKIERANEQLQNPKDDLPSVSLSVGVAFADRENPKGDIFKDADTALYRVKAAGRCGCEVF